MSHNYIVTQKDIQIIKQKNKQAYLRAQILNKDKCVIDTFEDVITNISVSMDATSDNRRSCAIPMHPSDDTYYAVSSNGKFWFNRYLRVYLGLYHNLSKTIQWYCIGTFLIDEDTFNISTDNGELNITCNDLYNMINGTEGGHLYASKTKIPAGKIISKVMAKVLSQLAEINDYFIDEMGKYYSIDYYIDLISKEHNLLPKLMDDGTYGYDSLSKYRHDKLLEAKSDANNENIICILQSSYDENDVVSDSKLYSKLFPQPANEQNVKNIIVIKLDDEDNMDMITTGVIENTVLYDSIFEDNDFNNLSIIIFIPEIIDTPDNIFNPNAWGYQNNSEYLTNEQSYYYMVASFKSIIEIPYTLEFDENSTVGDIVTSLKELYPGWEAFFNEYGTFICQMIPTSKNDIVVLDADVMNSIYIDVSSSYKLSDIKNVVKIVGSNIEPDRYTEECEVNGNTYIAYIDDFENYTVNQSIGIKIPQNNVNNMRLKIIGRKTDSNGETTEVELTDYPIYSSSSDKTFYPENTFLQDEVYVFYFAYNCFCYLGQFEANGVAMLVEEEPSEEVKLEHKTKYNCNNISYVIDSDSPFCVEKIGYRYVCNPDMEISEISYDSITSDSLAVSNAEYMLYKLSALKDTINLTTLIVPFLDVNQKIEFNNPLTNKTSDYIINSINYTLADGTMQISARRFTELYENH